MPSPETSDDDVRGVRCSLRIAGPKFNAHAESEIPEGTRIFCEYPPYEFGGSVAFSLAPEAQAKRRDAVEQMFIDRGLTYYPGITADAVLRVLGLST